MEAWELFQQTFIAAGGDPTQASYALHHNATLFAYVVTDPTEFSGIWLVNVEDGTVSRNPTPFQLLTTTLQQWGVFNGEDRIEATVLTIPNSITYIVSSPPYARGVYAIFVLTLTVIKMQ